MLQIFCFAPSISPPMDPVVSSTKTISSDGFPSEADLTRSDGSRCAVAANEVNSSARAASAQARSDEILIFHISQSIDVELYAGLGTSLSRFVHDLFAR